MTGRGGEKKLSMEEYIDFINSGKSIVDFTISYLDQIIHMHGFRKMSKTTKVCNHRSDRSALKSMVELMRKQLREILKTLGEAIDAMDLIDLSRSTLKQSGVSSSANLTLDQVITDIEDLKWQECCLTSLQIINSDEITRAIANPNQNSNKRKQVNEKKTTIKKKKNTKSIVSVNEAAPKTSGIGNHSVTISN